MKKKNRSSPKALYVIIALLIFGACASVLVVARKDRSDNKSGETSIEAVSSDTVLDTEDNEEVANGASAAVNYSYRRTETVTDSTDPRISIDTNDDLGAIIPLFPAKEN